MKKADVKLVSVVSPVYRGEKCVLLLCEEIARAFQSLGMDYEIILVEDGSPDDSWGQIVQAAAKDGRVRGIKLSRNFGQHYAITAGLDHARGDWVGVIDCDLEDHPKHFAILAKAMLDQDLNAIFAKRRGKKHSLFKRLSSRLFAYSFSYLSGTTHDSSIGTFSLLDRKVVDAFVQYRETLRTYTMLVHQLGFRIGYCETPHANRAEGRSSYSLKNLVLLALDTTVLYTEKPLRAIALLGLLMAFCAFAFDVYVVVAYLTKTTTAVGWSSLIGSIYLTAGLIIFAIGVNSIYLGKCFREGLRRPLYHIRETVGN